MVSLVAGSTGPDGNGDNQSLENIEFGRLLTILLAAMVLSSALGFLLLGWVLWRVRHINLPPDADFLTALRATPFAVVLLLDLLDFGLDVFSVPIAWIVLGRLGLAPLRGVTIFEELVPGTQMLPTMTVAWLLVRLAGRVPAARRRLQPVVPLARPAALPADASGR